MHCYITNSIGQQIHNTIPDELRDCILTCMVENESFIFSGKKYRHGKMSDEHGNIIYCITDDSDVVKKPRYFKEQLKAHLSLVPIINTLEQRIKTKSNAHTRRLIHNLESLNGHNIQELYNLVSEEALRDTAQENKKSLIQQKIKEHESSVHKTILNLVKNNASMKMEFSVFEKVMNGVTDKVDKQAHPLRKALMNVAHIFFQDFSDKNIRVEVAECDEKVFIDYESFYVSFYQIFDNAVKYALEGSNIDVTFKGEENTVVVIIEMQSLKIEKDEVSKITEDMFCGASAKKSGKNGRGIGMFNVKKTLDLNKSTMLIEPDIDAVSTTRNELTYQKNRFSITIPKYKYVKGDYVKGDVKGDRENKTLKSGA